MSIGRDDAMAADLVPVLLDTLVGVGRLADARAFVDACTAGLARRDLPAMRKVGVSSRTVLVTAVRPAP
ncbi:hypothetical protein [Nonomuraea sp. LPB2021202275-12-8]|uniref:hypothetical protein n=1 Tax=Nonomuraea sp. LPB2021202275-12-8 TaxID=3120159 RepID=UPI00300DA05E